MREVDRTPMQPKVAPASRAAIEPAYSVALLGGVAVHVDERPVQLTSSKGRALIGFLAWARAEEVKRESLCGLLWSESPDALAQSSLRQVLRSLRPLLGEGTTPLLRANRTGVSLDHARVRVDAIEIVEAVERGEIPVRLLREKRLTETLFEALDDVDPAFRAWSMVQRATLRARLDRSLEALLAVDGPRRRDSAEALINLDPTHEPACRTLMRLHAERGDTATALRLYRQLWELLDDEYDMEPSEPTQALVAEIKQGQIPVARSAPAQALAEAPASPWADAPVRSSGRLSLLITRFKYDGLPADKAFLVDGFRQELVVGLVRHRDWTIIDGELPVVSEQARSVTDYMLFASARAVDGTVHLLLTLYDHQRGEYLWSDRYALAQAGWFESQQRIVQRIAVGLNIHISAERLSRIAGQSETVLAVYDRWLLGQSLSLRWRPEEERKAEAIFHGIIDDAPEFAPAYSSLAQIMNSRHLVFPGRRRRRAAHAEALTLARRAVELDPLDPRTHLCLAWSFAMNGRCEPAITSYVTACELNENDPWTLVSSALGLAYCSDLDRARELVDRAAEVGLVLAPLHWGYFAGVRFLLGDYERCVDAADLAEDLPYYVPGWRVAALGQLGDRERARLEADKFLELIRSHWDDETEPTAEHVVAWFLHCFPIRTHDTWALLRDGLRLAGLPVAEAAAPLLPL